MDWGELRIFPAQLYNCNPQPKCREWTITLVDPVTLGVAVDEWHPCPQVTRVRPPVQKCVIHSFYPLTRSCWINVVTWS